MKKLCRLELKAVRSHSVDNRFLVVCSGRGLVGSFGGIDE